MGRNPGACVPSLYRLQREVVAADVDAVVAVDVEHEPAGGGVESAGQLAHRATARWRIAEERGLQFEGLGQEIGRAHV